MAKPSLLRRGKYKKGESFARRNAALILPAGKTRRIGFYNRCIPEPNSGCWLWLGPIMNMGYGTVTLDGKNVLAHRVSFELSNGPIPDGMHICHRCDNTYCVNPDHLFAGTPLDNMRDCINKGRFVPLKTMRGEHHANSKLTEKDVLAIRADKRMKKVVATDFKITRTMVWEIQSRKSWSHLP